MQKITVLCGSPRTNGSTARLCQAFSAGAEKAYEVEIIYVSRENIQPCIGCNGCYRDAEHRCVRSDGMTALYEKLAASEIIVVASPVYFYGISSQLKAVVDRLHAPYRNTFSTKKLGLILVGAATLPDLFIPILQQYEMVLRFFGLESIGEVCIDGVREPDALPCEALDRAMALGSSI